MVSRTNIPNFTSVSNFLIQVALGIPVTSDIEAALTAVSDVTGIPRATCIRKLEKLVLLGFLLRETKTKRYYINQNIADRTRNVVTRENMLFTIETFSQYL